MRTAEHQSEEVRQCTRKEGTIFIVDGNDKPVYASLENGYLIQKRNVLGNDQLVVSKVKDLTDDQLLLAVANSKKLEKLI